MKRLTTPQLELNAAMLAKRGRETSQKEMHFLFKKVHHFVNSATVLGMLKKFSTRFYLYEGIRINEIQTAARGDMCEWVWVSGKRNNAEWITRRLAPCDIDSKSEWWTG